MDPASFLLSLSSELFPLRCVVNTVVNACMLVTPVRTDRERWESWDWHGDKDCRAEQSLRPIVSHLVFWLPVVLRSGLGGTEGILAFSCYMQQTPLTGQRSRVSPTSYAVLKLLRHKSLHAGRKKKHTHGKKRKSQVGENIKNTLKCQFQFSQTARDTLKDREPGLVLVEVQ